MNKYLELKKKVLDVLNNNLPKALHYHGIHHTIDALEVCELYIVAEKVNSHDAEILRIGVLMHDIGFTVSIENHELRGIEMAEKLMINDNFDQNDIDLVKQLIMATQVPQNPKDHLEAIICDVDLDYLGRSDFYKIGERLYKEMVAYEKIMSREEWNKIQIKFLEAHKYHTVFAQKNRQPQKEKRILELKDMFATSKK